MLKPPLITLLTDFGLADHYVAAMKGVVLGICPEARLVDISHEVRPFAVAEAAFTLGQAYPCFPAGTTHLVVVDPGVGSARRPLLVEADGHRFIAPDNGILTWPIDRDPGHSAREITAASFFRQPVSGTFHGRDIFAPVAARLASGIPVAEFGEIVGSAVRLDFAPATRDEVGVWQGRILYVDRFGNLVTNIRASDAPQIAEKRFKMVFGTTETSWYHPSYASANHESIFVIEGSSGFLEVSINQGDAARVAGVAVGAAITLRLT